MLHIDLSPFGEGVHSFTLEPTPDMLDLDPEMFSDVLVDVHLTRQRERVLVLMDARATAALTCDRTLRPFEQEVKGDYGVLFAPPDAAVSEDDEAFEEVREWTPSDQHLDVTDMVRDTLMLALPQRRVAPGAEQEDIETRFGAAESGEERIDPRWEKLRQLKEQEDSASSPASD